MKIFGCWTALVVGLYVLQSSVFPLIAFHGVSPNFLLLLTVSFAFLRGARYGVLMGFCTGLLQDLATGTFFGVDIFSYMFLGFFCGKFSDRVFKEQFFLPVFASIAATFMHYVILVVFMLLMGYSFHVGIHAQRVLFPMLIYQLLFAYPVHKLTYSLENYTKDSK